MRGQVAQHVSYLDMADCGLAQRLYFHFELTVTSTNIVSIGAKAFHFLTSRRANPEELAT
jgi:hypothetical protein